ncbi:hypothetical protein ACFQX7_02910 [Luedemannella flava]
MPCRPAPSSADAGNDVAPAPVAPPATRRCPRCDQCHGYRRRGPRGPPAAVPERGRRPAGANDRHDNNSPDNGHHLERRPADHGGLVGRDPAGRPHLALAALPTGRHGEFSVAVRNNRTGGTYRYRASDTYETASIVKVDILAAVLLRAQDDGRSLTDAERSAATRMIRASDNDAATYLWNRAGGASGVRAANRRLGLTHTTPGTEGWGLTRTTVGDQVTLVNRALGTSGPLTSASRAYIRGLMTTVNGDQDWGVPAAAHRGDGRREERLAQPEYGERPVDHQQHRPDHGPGRRPDGGGAFPRPFRNVHRSGPY